MAAKKITKVGIGKCDVYVKDIEDESAKWLRVPTPVQNSTQLNPTQGEKQEAKVEGGDNEDVIYGRNNYSAVMQIRRTSNRDMPIKHIDGTVAHNYAMACIPRGGKEGVPGFYIPNSSVQVQDSFTTTDGGTDLYTFDALAPDDGGDDSKKVKWGVITATEAEGTITLTGKGGDFSEEGDTL